MKLVFVGILCPDNRQFFSGSPTENAPKDRPEFVLVVGGADDAAAVCNGEKDPGSCETRPIAERRDCAV